MREETVCELGGRVGDADPISDDEFGVLPTDRTLLPTLKHLQPRESEPDPCESLGAAERGRRIRFNIRISALALSLWQP